MPRKLVAGNWKMNGSLGFMGYVDALAVAHGNPFVEIDILICPPATLIAPVAEKSGSLAVGAQDCHENYDGAHTGDISAGMLHEAGASYVILGHSERRTDHGETNADVCAKCEAAWSGDLIAIVCVGETEAQRDAGETLDVIAEQLNASIPGDATAENLVIAYEPVWAIGTGKVPTLEQIAEVHQFMRSHLDAQFDAEMAQGTRLLYGGSVKPDNAEDIFAVPNVDGALVGGASLKVSDFSSIINELEAAAVRES